MVGSTLAGKTSTVTVVVTMPRRPSLTVTTKVSVAAGAPTTAAAWRAAAVGV